MKISEVKIIKETRADEVWNMIRDARNALPRGSAERTRLSNLMNQINRSSTSDTVANEILRMANLDGETPPETAPETPAAAPSAEAPTRAREVWNMIRAARDALPEGPERVRLSNLMNQINVNSTPDNLANAILADANLGGNPDTTDDARAARTNASDDTPEPRAEIPPERPGPRPAPTPGGTPATQDPEAGDGPEPSQPAQADTFTLSGNLRRGSRGDEVRRLQAALGLPATEQDGIFGPRTEQAVRTFQQSQGLQVDGIVGRQTLAAIQRSRENPNAPRNVTPGQITAPAPTPTPQNQSKENTGNALVESVLKNAGVNMKQKLDEASITINGGAEEIAELMRMMQLAGAPGAKPVDIDDINPGPKPCPMCGKVHGPMPTPCGAKMGPQEPSMGDMISMISKEEEDMDGDFQDASTEPDETYMNDVSASIPAGNDLHKEKDAYPPVNGGDNPMKIKEQLLKALAEKKKAKPDYLDFDGDGNKKEPMKKALKDKKKK